MFSTYDCVKPVGFSREGRQLGLLVLTFSLVTSHHMELILCFLQSGLDLFQNPKLLTQSLIQLFILSLISCVAGYGDLQGVILGFPLVNVGKPALQNIVQSFYLSCKHSDFILV